MLPTAGTAIATHCMKAVLTKLKLAAPMKLRIAKPAKLKIALLTELRLAAQRKIVSFQEVLLDAYRYGYERNCNNK